jgi:hypothetical protein
MVEDVLVPPLISPLPAEGAHFAATDPDCSATAITQPMPIVAPPAAPSRPAIPPPAPSDEGATSAPAQRANGKPLTAPGVYRFTAPNSERRKKR